MYLWEDNSRFQVNPNVFFFPSCLFQFKPLEQLMGVFPAASGNFIPPTWRNLMSNPVSFSVLLVYFCV